MSIAPTVANSTSPLNQPVTAQEAAVELKQASAKIAQVEAFFHQREKTMMLSVWVTDWSVRDELPLINGKFKGFEIIWGFYVPQGTDIQ